MQVRKRGKTFDTSRRRALAKVRVSKPERLLRIEQEVEAELAVLKRPGAATLLRAASCSSARLNGSVRAGTGDWPVSEKSFQQTLATLRRLLEESGDPTEVGKLDLEAWVARWMREPRPEFGNKTPAEMSRSPEGQRAIEQALGRMRGGLPA